MAKLTTEDAINLITSREIPTVIPYVINSCYGGFGVSEEAADLYSLYYGKKIDRSEIYFVDRTDPILVRVVKELGGNANDRYSNLRITYVYKEYEFDMYDHDGIENVYPDYNYDNIVDALLDDENMSDRDIVTLLRKSKKLAIEANQMMINIRNNPTSRFVE